MADVSIANPDIFIKNWGNDETLIGDIFVEVVSALDELDYEISLSIDSSSIGSRNKQPDLEGRWLVVFSVPTYRYSNGQHHLSAYASFEYKHEIRVNFQNDIFDFYCDGIYAADDIAVVSAKMLDKQKWRIDIHGPRGDTIRMFEGFGDKIDVEWDGSDTHAVRLPNGSYRLSLLALESETLIRDTLNISFD